ncbi:MAG: FHA domain-containing protein [Gammaproteobacteria bacterium]|nr:FHA domain-containing protein [Gammaproteobacteria bacterium]
MLRRILLVMFLVGSAPAPMAWDAVTGEAIVRCQQPDLKVLRCDYRTLTAAGAEISLQIGDDVQTGVPTPYPWSGAKSALLFLVDTSDPGRAGIVERNVAQIGSLARAARSHQQIGLAHFDKDLELLAPVGSTAEAVAGAAHRLRATGMTTELYHNLLRAVKLAGSAEADRRFVVIYSDGQAEDTAYGHDDVVSAARGAGVSIISLGFPRSVPRSVALQTLRRLSEETGGQYVESGPAGELPAGFEQRIFAAADSGGRIDFELPGTPATDTTSPTASLIVRTGRTEQRFEVPIRVPPSPLVKPASVPATAPAATAPTSPGPVPAQRPGSETWLWYGVPGLLLILILLALVTLYMLLRQPRRTGDGAHAAASAPKPFAYLITQSDHPKRYPIGGAVWRIGRSRENELVLEDISISRRHAEIQRGSDGAFAVVDRGARNGLFVNGRKVQRQTLHEGDLIEVGDVVLRFTEIGADEQLQEQTAIQHTRQPRTAA